MAFTSQRRDSSNWRFRQRVPVDVLGKVRGRRIIISFPSTGREPPFTVETTIGTEVSFSTRTPDKNVHEARSLVAQTHLAKIYAAARTEPVKLSSRTLTALSKDIYDLFLATHGDDPGPVRRWEAFKGFSRAAMEGRIQDAPELVPGSEPDEAAAAEARFGPGLTQGIDALPASDSTAALEQRFGRLANWLLAERGIELLPEQRPLLLKLTAMAAIQAGRQLKKHAAYDFSPDPEISRFPTFEPPSEAGGSHRTLTDVFERWRKETHPSASTVSTWRGVVASLKRHLGHEVVGRITHEDIVRWKDRLVDAGLSRKTISHNHLAAIKALLNFEIQNKRLAVNPAAGIKMGVKRRAGQRMRPYTDNEVARILALAARETSPAQRWLPWLAALSGARIGEVAQLWGQRITMEDGIAVMVIRPAEDGGSLKNEWSERTVPIHPAIIEAGFLDFVRQHGSGPLFYRRSSGDPSKKHASKGVTNRLAAWIREQGFTDPRKAPNHALRHWFVTMGQRLHINDSVIEAIIGHEEGSEYRHGHTQTLYEAIIKIPVPVETGNQNQTVGGGSLGCPAPTRHGREPPA
ncbi:site-specific integrase [Microvirga arsenatis]|uniref:Tyrosine-type recombinase/integrase n=1 Tax=Microvirga arsenatis TaxID=2692265 RepID=A0ABW9YVV8_9HYPH|nr:site-specific integrase [Microvirga arsenatis]NBJ09341.1 tyrosine-type recombinase/integrase [Microvirga arsenatis]NBJ23801.1 tyrosine-type recombinase/integrase [Microvirga arsenatis]